jgi:PST family polysaccharide transporter
MTDSGAPEQKPEVAEPSSNNRPAAPARSGELGATAARGVFWAGGGQAARQVIGVCTAIILARLLSPEEFGLIAMAYVAIEFGNIFADVGIGTAIVQQRDADPVAWSSAFWINLVTGGVLCALIAAAAPAIAAFYSEPRLTWLIVALALSLLVSALQALPRAILHRAMQFDRIAQSEVAGSIVGSGVAIVMATNGFAVWSLVAQPMVTAIVTFLLSWIASGWMPRTSFHWQAVRPYVHFSLPLLGADILQFFTKNTDRVLIGRFLGGVPLGIYGLATQIMLYPMANVSAVVGRVLFPVFSRMQEEHGRLRDAYVKVTSAVAGITFPAMLGLFAVVDDFVAAVFGADWAPMAPILKVLCWVGLTHSITGTLTNIYLSTGNTSILWRLGLIATPLTIVGYIVGLQWGVVGVAVGYAVTSYALLYLKLRMAFRLIDLPMGRFLWELRGPFGTALAMAAGVMLVQAGLDEVAIVAPLARLAISIAAGVGLYVTLNLALNRAQWRDVYILCRSATAQQK